MSTISKITDKLLDYIFPPRCMACEDILNISEPARFCPTCFGELQPCSYTPGEQHFSAYVYNEVAKQAVHSFKYGKNRDSGRYLGRLMAERFLLTSHTIVILQGVDALVPVPLHEAKERERGFNQAQILATEISKATNIPVMEAALVRTRNTEAQAGLGKSERNQNMMGAFAQGAQPVTSKTVLIIDDVFTTGSTIQECMKALHLSGASHSFSYTFARALSQDIGQLPHRPEDILTKDKYF